MAQVALGQLVQDLDCIGVDHVGMLAYHNDRSIGDEEVTARVMSGGGRRRRGGGGGGAIAAKPVADQRQLDRSTAAAATAICHGDMRGGSIVLAIIVVMSGEEGFEDPGEGSRIGRRAGCSRGCGQDARVGREDGRALKALGAVNVADLDIDAVLGQCFQPDLLLVREAIVCALDFDKAGSLPGGVPQDEVGHAAAPMPVVLGQQPADARQHGAAQALADLQQRLERVGRPVDPHAHLTAVRTVDRAQQVLCPTVFNQEQPLLDLVASGERERVGY